MGLSLLFVSSSEGSWFIFYDVFIIISSFLRNVIVRKFPVISDGHKSCSVLEFSRGHAAFISTWLFQPFVCFVKGFFFSFFLSIVKTFKHQLLKIIISTSIKTHKNSFLLGNVGFYIILGIYCISSFFDRKREFCLKPNDSL